MFEKQKFKGKVTWQKEFSSEGSLSKQSEESNGWKFIHYFMIATSATPIELLLRIALRKSPQALFRCSSCLQTSKEGMSYAFGNSIQLVLNEKARAYGLALHY